MGTLFVSSISGCAPVTISEGIQSPSSTASGNNSIAYGSGFNGIITKFEAHVAAALILFIAGMLWHI